MLQVQRGQNIGRILAGRPVAALEIGGGIDLADERRVSEAISGHGDGVMGLAVEQGFRAADAARSLSEPPSVRCDPPPAPHGRTCRSHLPEVRSS